jgi:hypothetical protein
MAVENLFLAAGLLLALVALVAVLAWRFRSETVIQIPVSGASAPGISTGGDWPPDAVAIPEAQLVPVSHPLVKRSLESVLRKGGSAASYVVRRNGELFLTFELLPDPVERSRAYELFRQLNAGEDVDMQALIAVIRKIGMAEA